MMIKREIKTGRIILIILLMSFLGTSLHWAGVRTGKAKKPKIGVIQFSVNVFDENKNVVKEARRKIENLIHKAIRTKLKFKKGPYLKNRRRNEYSIEYSDIESPEVTIDPVVKSSTKQRLQALCETKRIDAVVFGHFQEEDALYVIIRYYVKNDKIYSLPPQTIPLDGLSIERKRKAIKAATNSLSKQLFKELKANANTLRIISKQKIQKSLPKRQSSPAKNLHKGKPKLLSPRKLPAIGALTAKDVYDMIIDRGFYCETVTGSGFHEEGLKGRTLSKFGIFSQKRKISAATKNKLVESDSYHKNKKTDKISLLWKKKPIECTFEQAQKKIQKLNAKNTDKRRRWRLPTLMEMFSIMKEKKKNHFPSAFRIPKKRTVVFWTSTPLERKGTVLDYENDEAVLVLKNSYSKNTDNYSVTFRFAQTRSTIKNWIIPVYSNLNDIYAYKTQKSVQSPKKLAGFDDNPSIKGFEDKIAPPQKARVPSSSKKNMSANNPPRIPGFDDIQGMNVINTKKRRGKKNTRPGHGGKKIESFKVTLIPNACSASSTGEKDFLNTINNEIEKELQLLNKKLHKIDLHAEIELIDAYSNDILTNILWDILYQESEYELDEHFISDVAKFRLLKPNHIDIAISVINKTDDEDNYNRIYLLKIITISNSDNEARVTRIVGNIGEFSNLRDTVRDHVVKAIRNKFRYRRLKEDFDQLEN